MVYVLYEMNDVEINEDVEDYEALFVYDEHVVYKRKSVHSKRSEDAYQMLTPIHTHIRKQHPIYETKYFTADLENYCIERNGKKVSLNAASQKLLELFLVNPHQILTRDFLLDALEIGDKYLKPNTLDKYIHILRKILGDTDKTIIKTHSYIGYCFDEDVVKLDKMDVD